MHSYAIKQISILKLGVLPYWKNLFTQFLQAAFKTKKNWTYSREMGFYSRASPYSDFSPPTTDYNRQISSGFNWPTSTSVTLVHNTREAPALFAPRRLPLCVGSGVCSPESVDSREAVVLGVLGENASTSWVAAGVLSCKTVRTLHALHWR